MDEIRIKKVITELMRLLRNISESEEEYYINDINEIVDRVDVDIEKIKEELGPWYIPDYKLYVGT